MWGRNAHQCILYCLIYIPCQKFRIVAIFCAHRPIVCKLPKGENGQNWLAKRKYGCFASVPNVNRLPIFSRVLREFFGSKEFSVVFLIAKKISDIIIIFYNSKNNGLYIFHTYAIYITFLLFHYLLENIYNNILHSNTTI